MKTRWWERPLHVSTDASMMTSAHIKGKNQLIIITHDAALLQGSKVRGWNRTARVAGGLYG